MKHQKVVDITVSSDWLFFWANGAKPQQSLIYNDTKVIYETLETEDGLQFCFTVDLND